MLIIVAACFYVKVRLTQTAAHVHVAFTVCWSLRCSVSCYVRIVSADILQLENRSLSWRKEATMISIHDSCYSCYFPASISCLFGRLVVRRKRCLLSSFRLLVFFKVLFKLPQSCTLQSPLRASTVSQCQSACVSTSIMAARRTWVLGIVSWRRARSADKLMRIKFA